MKWMKTKDWGGTTQTVTLGTFNIEPSRRQQWCQQDSSRSERC